ncbi:WXG100 family type VII secretion target [Streptacidiphilus sp. EB129]|uniref:WXG100 family type VII secretion target n=1 Tax=Streptacidiphilus sp. EB129 TaxID=3156262 RepID=UPI003514931E
MRPSDGGDSWSATTDFEKIPHAKLLTMVAGADPQAVLAVGNALADAGTQMQTLADDLLTHINGLQWTSAAGDSFRAWGQQVVSATDTLAIYTSNTSTSIMMAGETLSSTKLPEIPAGPQSVVDAYSCQLGAQMVRGQDGTMKVAQPLLFSTNTPGQLPGSQTPLFSTGSAPLGGGQVTQQAAYQAQLKLDAAHQEAIGQMEKLGGSYYGAQQTMMVSTVPNFPPTPGDLMPPRGSGSYDGSGNVTLAGGGTSRTGSSGGGTVKVRKTSGVRTSAGGSGTTGQGGSETPVTPVHAPNPGSGGSSPSGGGTTTLQGFQPPTSPTSPVGGTSGASGPIGGTSDGTGGGAGGVTVGLHPVGGGATGVSLGSKPKPGAGGTGIHGGEPGPAASPAGRRGSGLGAGAVGEGGSGFAGGSGAVAGEGSGSSTARAGLVAEAAAERGTPTAETTAGSGMMPMGSGGIGGQGRGRNRNRRRASYLVADEAGWIDDESRVNPAVIQ